MKRASFAGAALRYRAELLALLGCAACGGHTVAEPEPERPAPSASSAGSGGSATTPSQGGTSSQSEPDPEPEPEPFCDGPQPVCVPDCTSLERTSSQCDGQIFLCQNGWVDLDSCSKDACARRSQSCCLPTGQTEIPDCAPDGTIGDCPAGSTQTSTCVPEGLGISDCSQLVDGTACASEELLCYTGKCGRNCYCNIDESRKLRWQCWINAC